MVNYFLLALVVIVVLLGGFFAGAICMILQPERSRRIIFRAICQALALLYFGPITVAAMQMQLCRARVDRDNAFEDRDLARASRERLPGAEEEIVRTQAVLDLAYGLALVSGRGKFADKVMRLSNDDAVKALYRGAV